MDIVLGLSMTPAAIRMVLVEGENADGVTVEEDEFEVAAAGSATDQVLVAILGTREGADEAGHQVTSIGVISTDQLEVGALRDALAARKVDNVMLISAFLAAAAMAQAVGQAVGYERIAMLFVEPESATLAVVEAADGAVADVHKESLHGVDALTELTELVAEAEALETRPEGLFVIGSGVDIASMKPRLETATSLAVSAPEEPETALARGAALASARASLLASSTETIVYVCDSVIDKVSSDTVPVSYSDAHTLPAGVVGEENAAYSAVPDEDASAVTAVIDTGEEAGLNESLRQRRPVLLLGSVAAVGLVSAVVAMEVVLALGIRPTAVGLQRTPGQNPMIPSLQVPLVPPAMAAAQQPRLIGQQVPVATLPRVNAFAAVPATSAPVPADPPPVPAPGMRVSMPTPNYPILLPLPVAQPNPTSLPAPSLPALQFPLPVSLPLPGPVSQPPTSPVSVSQPPPTVPVSQPPTTVPVSQPPRTVPVSQPPRTVPVSQPPTTVPVSQPPTTVLVSQPPTTVPVSQPLTTVPVSQPPAPVPVSHPPTHVAVPPVPVYVPEPQLPVNFPAPAAPPLPVSPGLDAPPVIGRPFPDGPPTLGSPGFGGSPAPDVPPVVPQLPHSFTPPAQEPSPTLGGPVSPGSGSGGAGGGSLGGGPASPGSGSPGGSLGGSSGGSLGGGSSPGGSSGGSLSPGGSSGGSLSPGGSSGGSHGGGGTSGGGGSSGHSSGGSSGGHSSGGGGHK